MDFNKHLKKQLGFLERSCESYDRGYHDEAIRIATVLRVLIHDTNRSKSLLKHLDSTDITLRSTSRDPGSSVVHYFGMGLYTMKANGDCAYTPMLDQGPPFNSFKLVSEWWEQIVYVLNAETRLSRRKIVLAATNKDGGAHVDEKLSPEYELLASEGAVGSFVYERNGEQSETPIKDAHLVSLRQMAYEILNSPSIVSIANNEKV